MLGLGTCSVVLFDLSLGFFGYYLDLESCVGCGIVVCLHLWLVVWCLPWNVVCFV